MKATNRIGLVTLVVLLGCGGSSSLKNGSSGGAKAGGQGGNPSGSGTGSSGAAAGGGSSSVAGTSMSTGGAGQGGSSFGSSVGGGGSSGTTCPYPSGTCLFCPGGYLPERDPCVCPQCAPVDGGVVKDAAPDVCLVPTCDLLPSCPAGQTRMSRPCACPVCVPDDAGQPDAPRCPPTCPMVKCAYGSVRDPVCGCPTCIDPDAGVGKDAAPSKDVAPDVCLQPPCLPVLCPAGTRAVEHACACPTCEPVDAGADAEKSSCAGFDECRCFLANGCSVIAESCYCPYPKCSQGGACVCGGGKFVGCAPVGLGTCAAAKARVAGLCPTLPGPFLDGLCTGTDSACVTKCLNEVTSCDDLSCSSCEACRCAADAFMRCRDACQKQLGS